VFAPRWGRSGMPTTTQWRRASSPRSNASCSIAIASRRPPSFAIPPAPGSPAIAGMAIATTELARAFCNWQLGDNFNVAPGLFRSANRVSRFIARGSGNTNAIANCLQFSNSQLLPSSGKSSSNPSCFACHSKIFAQLLGRHLVEFIPDCFNCQVSRNQARNDAQIDCRTFLPNL
jgi:hypothetical protein